MTNEVIDCPRCSRKGTARNVHINATARAHRCEVCDGRGRVEVAYDWCCLGVRRWRETPFVGSSGFRQVLFPHPTWSPRAGRSET